MILFLDFDGVLHPFQARDEGYFCCVPHLLEILRQHPEIRVVFSTSWRGEFPFPRLVEFVTADGRENLAHRFIDSTPYLSQNPEQPFGHSGCMLTDYIQACRFSRIITQ